MAGRNSAFSSAFNFVFDALRGKAGKRVAAPAAALLAAPYRDDFSGAAGTITGRAVGDKAWAGVFGASGNANPNVLDGSGHLNGGAGSLPNYSMTELDTGLSAGKWYRAELNANPSAAAAFVGTNPQPGWFVINDSYVATNNWNRMVYNANGTINFSCRANSDIRSGGGTELLHTNTDSAGKGVYAQAGDVFELRKKTVGGTVYIEPYYNGQRIGPDLNVSSQSVPINDKFAIQGDLQTSAQLDAIMVGDPAVHAMLSVYVPRVPQVNADGSFVLSMSGDFTGPAPAGLTVTLYDKATDAPIAGYTAAAVASYATGAAKTESSSGSWTGKLSVAGGVVASTGAYVVVTRSDQAAPVTARSCVFTPGDAILIYGQSLGVKMWAEATAGVTYTAPANGWTVDGSLDNNGSSTVHPTLAVNRKTRPVNGSLENTLTTAYMAAILDGIAGATLPHSYVRTGFGGTYYYQRQPSDPTATGIWGALLDGLRLAGGDVAYVFDVGGEYEAVGAPSTVGTGYTLSTFTSTDQANLVSYFQAIYDGLEAAIGRAVKVFVRPIGAIFTGADARCEAMRRLQWKLTQDYPSRYILGGYSMDLQHVTASDQYHLNGYQEQGRRLIYALAKAKGLTAFDRSGPKLFSVSAWSDTSVTVRFDKNGASGLEVVNTVATLTDYRGGLTFATDSGFTAEKVPTAVSAATDIDGTYAEITWTFAAGSFPTKPYVRGPYGFNPFNRTNNATVNGAIQTQGSMVRGIFTGEAMNIPVQPYYSAAGDYIAGA